MEKIATSIVRCGDDSNVKYKEIFLGFRHQWVPEGHVGCALTCAPYIVMAKKAIPKSGPASMLKMTISDWEKAMGLR
jgi:histidine decarboxylase